MMSKEEIDRDDFEKELLSNIKNETIKDENGKEVNLVEKLAQVVLDAEHWWGIEVDEEWLAENVEQLIISQMSEIVRKDFEKSRERFFNGVNIKAKEVA